MRISDEWLPRAMEQEDALNVRFDNRRVLEEQEAQERGEPYVYYMPPR